MEEREIDRIIDERENELESIADKFDLPPVRINEVAGWVLKGKTNNQIEKLLVMNVTVTREWPEAEAEDELTVLCNCEEIIKKVKDTLFRGTSQFFNGLIDEIRSYNRALSVAEIKASLK